MSPSISDRLASLGLTLPAVPAPVAAYVNCVRSGNLLFLSGGLPIDGEKKVIGKVPTDVSIEDAKEGARIIILNRLAVIQDAIGSLDKVTQIVSLTEGFDFLGFTVRRQSGKLLIKPSKAALRRIRERLRT